MRIQKVRANHAQQPWESCDQMRICTMKLSSSLRSLTLQFQLLVVWCCITSIEAEQLNQKSCQFWNPCSDMVFECNNSYCSRNSSAIVWCLWAKCNEWGEVRQWVRQFKDGPCMMKIKEATHPSWMVTFLKKSTTKFVKIFVSQFQSYQCVFHKLHIHYSMKLLQRACTTMKSVQDGCPKC